MLVHKPTLCACRRPPGLRTVDVVAPLEHSPFHLLVEIDPPDGSPSGSARLQAQVEALAPVASTFLVPDNHLGRPAVSSLVVAADIDARPTIACLNARDRNLLGVRRDLLTARHLGVDELLLLRGDAPTVGGRAGELGVRDLVAECERAGLRYGVTGGGGRLPDWKRGAERVVVQVAWSVEDLRRRAELLSSDLPVYAGVLVVASAAMARRLGDRVPELAPPSWLVDALERDRLAGVHAAIELVEAIEDSGAFAGVHLVPGARSAEVAEALVRSRADRSSVRAPTTVPVACPDRTRAAGTSPPLVDADVPADDPNLRRSA